MTTLTGATGPELPLEKLSAPESAAPAPARVSAVSADVDAEATHETPRIAVADIPIDIPPQTATEENSEPVPAHLPPLVPIVKPIIPRSRAEICDSLTAAAQSNDLPVPFFIRLLFQESGFRPGAVSRAGAEGIAQFMPETSQSRGLDNPYDPLQAIAASARLLRDLAQQFGNFGLAAAAYNAGPRRVQNWLAKKGKLPQETQGYVKIITGRPAELWTAAKAGSPAIKVQRHAPCQEAAGLLAWDGPDHIPMPPTRTPHSGAKLATRAHVKIAHHGVHMTKPLDLVAADYSAKAGAKKEIKQEARKEAKKDTKQEIKHVSKQRAVHLASGKPKHHALQVSQR